MRQSEDLSYGESRELANHPVLESFFGIRLRKLSKYHTMDWEEIREDGDDSPPWYIEQKARRLTFEECSKYKHKGISTVIIGKNKLDFMAKTGNGIVVMDFKDRLMYWVYDKNEMNGFDVEDYVRGAREDCTDMISKVVHIPMSSLKQIEVG